LATALSVGINNNVGVSCTGRVYATPAS
jgi:hypothetical protein